jgi:UDP-glucose 4-epimerase
MSRYLITGGLGFIGARLANVLAAAGHRVTIVDNLSTGNRGNVEVDCDVVIGDVNDRTLIREVMSGMDGCFHLAACGQASCPDQDDIGYNNLQGIISVLAAAKDSAGKEAVPVVYASSSITYGDNAHTSLGESVTARPLTSAAADKAGIEMRARVATLAHGVPTTGLRLFNIYGHHPYPTGPNNGVIADFMQRILNGQPITIYGDGHQTRDFVYLADAVEFFIAAMSKPSRQPAIYNVCTGRQTSIRQLAEMMSSLCARPVEIRHAPPRKGDIRTSVGNPELAIRHLGLRATTTLADGLNRLLRCLSPRTAAGTQTTPSADNHRPPAPLASFSAAT